MNLTKLSSWRSLQKHALYLQDQSLRDLFTADPQRARSFQLRAEDLTLDYSKQRIDSQALSYLLKLAEQTGVPGAIEQLFTGGLVNQTEQRPALHMALRGSVSDDLMVGSQHVTRDVKDVLQKMERFVKDIHRGVLHGATGQRFLDIVHIGIGGSSLGPELVIDALRAYRHPVLRVHFVTNVDGESLARALQGLSPDTTLFVIASKTFTTQETLKNAQSARQWLVDSLGEEAVGHHFVAISAAPHAVKSFGITSDHLFPFWDWVGGRYSLWSAIGLSIALIIGMDNFLLLLKGAHLMDLHFRKTPLEKNMPVLMALIGLWNINFLNYSMLGIFPYAESLALLVPYLQQLEMESNGKSVTQDGQPVSYATAPLLFGGTGTTMQHSVFQFLHQGTSIVPCDFIFIQSDDAFFPGHHTLLHANGLAQADALMYGRDLKETKAFLQDEGLRAQDIQRLIPHRTFSGNRPSHLLTLPKLTPKTLGQLLALYEHKTFVQGVLWGINSFDQFGVELGKTLAHLRLS